MLTAWLLTVLTHTVTHTEKRAGGNNGGDRAKGLISLEQKRPESPVLQRIERFQSLGKDEVPGSNPGSSSKKLLKSYDFGSFCYFYA